MSAAVAGSPATDTDVETSNVDTVEPAQEVVEQEVQEPKPEEKEEPVVDNTPQPAFSDGQFIVGSDVQPGTYFVNTFSGCYWERQANFNGDLDSIISNELISVTTGQSIVTILESDKGFQSQNCGSWYKEADVEKFGGVFTSIPDGTHFVGSQVAAGTYRTTSAGDSCYWERMADFKGGVNSIIANDLGGSTIVTIAASDTGFKSTDCGSWEKQ